MIDTSYDIPRVFTSIAEVLACLIYMQPLKKKYTGFKHYFFVGIGAVIIVLIQLVSGELPVIVWIPGMLTAMLAMYLYIRNICDLSSYDAGFLFVRAFILAEFVASVEWQTYYYLLYKGMSNSWELATLVMILIYLPLFVLVYWIDARKVPSNRSLGVGLKELINALIIGSATFAISNLNYIVESPFVARQVEANIMYVRTLIDFSGFLVLFAWNQQRQEMYLARELNVINDILNKHYNQYRISKESIDIINRKHHDLKHQIALIRAEKDPKKIDEYLEDIDYAMKVYDSIYDTGSTVIDTILTAKSLQCNQLDIKLTCVVNGKLLNFIRTMDVCSIFGNALDNAIESVEKVCDKEKRIISIAVFSKNNFLMMRFENYYEHQLKFKDELFMTTKSDDFYHGYGIKSIKKTIEKYDGNVTISTDDHWFVMKILVPMPQDSDNA